MAALNKNLLKLFDIAQKDEKTGIGLMSGTSLDGLDIALCRFKGSGFTTEVSLLHFTTVAYPESYKQEIRKVFALKNGRLEQTCLLNAFTGSYHAELVLNALKEWHIDPERVDFIASHGQTIYHAPKSQHRQEGYPNATLQIGDGDHLAVKTGILTISDFRQKHISAGGEGAPLALYGDVLLAGNTGENRILVNIGGIANITYLPSGRDLANVVCTDIGPGNTIIDAACQRFFNSAYDEDSRIAFSGKVNAGLLTALQDHPFFKLKGPKTTGPELFNMDYLEQAQKTSGTENIDKKDVITTLTTFSAANIAGHITNNFKQETTKIFISGGGAKNIYMLEQLKTLLSWATIEDTGAIGIDPDAKEAVLFALLGNEAICGEPLIIGNNPAVLMGKFSFPL